MKYFILLFFVVFCTLQYSFCKLLTDEEVSHAVKTCRKKTNSTDDDADYIYKLDMFAKTKPQFCMTACFYKEIKMMDENNKLNLNQIIEELIERFKETSADLSKHVKAMYTECITAVVPDKDECITIEKIVKCLWDKAKAMGIEKQVQDL